MKSEWYLKYLRKGEVMHGITIAVKVGEVSSFRVVYHMMRYLRLLLTSLRKRRRSSSKCGHAALFVDSGLGLAHPFVEESPRFLIFLEDELGR